MAHLALKSAPPSANDQVENTSVNARTASTAFMRFFILFTPKKLMSFKTSDQTQVNLFQRDAQAASNTCRSWQVIDAPSISALSAVRAPKLIIGLSPDHGYLQA